MKTIFSVCITILSLGFAGHAFAQQDSSKHDAKNKKSYSLEWADKGLQIRHADSASISVRDTTHNKFESHWIMLDLGLNFMHIANNTRGSFYDLRQAKSINVNINFWMGTWSVLSTKNQKINISTGIGLQLYNFRYENPVTYTRNPASVIRDTISFKKDKLAFDYLTVPIMFTFKSRISKKHWLVYGVGITGGYRIGSWTKQVSTERGKVKVHDQFDFADFNSCLTGEIGINPGIRFYASYQLTSIYKDNIMDQRPICVGIRISGI